jgi:ABC-type transport system involved in multi-copper enzyme maturation permease subunit
MILGPVFWMEMRTGARRARHYGTRVFFVSVVFALVVIAWYSFLSYRAMMRGMYGYSGVLVSVFTPLAPHELPQLGHKIFSAYSMTQFLLVLFLAPLYSAGAVAADRERRVLEMIFTTDLSNMELVASKFLVRTIHLLALTVAGLPVMFLCLLLGGVAAEDLLATFALTLAVVVFVSSLGLLISIGTRRAYGAVIVTYLILLVAWLAMPFIAGTLVFGGGPPIASWYSDICMAIISLNPVLVLMGVVIDGGGFPGLWSDAPWVCSAAYGVAALVLMVINVLVIRRLGLWASRERVVRDRKKDRKRRTRQVWSNPVAWREVKTIAIHRRMRWARILCLLFSFMFTAILWVGWIADWLQGRPALAMDVEQFSGLIPCTATVAWVLMALQGAVSFSYEREQSTLDALLTTPLAGHHIVLGKLQGIVRSSAFALAFPIGFALIAWSRDVTTTRATLLSIALVLLVGIFAACLGLACSVRLGSSGKACGAAAGIMLVLCLGVPMASETFIGWGRKHAWHKITFVSPSQNLSWAIYDERSPTVDSRYYRHDTNYRQWPQRLTVTGVHLCLEQLLAVLCVSWSIARIESTCRVRQWGLSQGFGNRLSAIRRWLNRSAARALGTPNVNDSAPPLLAGRARDSLDARADAEK